MAKDGRRNGRSGSALRSAGRPVFGPRSGDVPVEAASLVADLVALGGVVLGGVPETGRPQPVRQQAEAVQAVGDLALGHRRALGAGVMVGIIADHFRCAIAR